ncbi:MAG: tRNA (adenosine(37)-N6)-dimethylallyltransferase MiaA [Dehalococcoidia bacterium]|nr:tRNA (adenosine(37)-N6)-dimethylallyltransferase MiaA [Dehalococcoidia bacterium]
MAKELKGPIVAIVGPTGVGKSGLAVDLASRVNGEIVNADSRQFYKRMDIGTAKPPAQMLARVRHHLIDILEPDEKYSLALYQEQAYSAFDDTLRDGKQPFLVGGSGLYVKAIVKGMNIPRVEPSFDRRAELEQATAEKGSGHLYRQLQSIDPEAAAKIEPQNVRRIIRALEVYETTGHKFSETGSSEPKYSFLIIGLTCPRDELYHRIDMRVDQMIKDGLADEVKALLKKGYPSDLPSMSGIGYSQITAFLEGKLTLADAVKKIKFDTHNFARHQYAWFRLKDPDITWLDITGNKWHEEASNLIEKFIENHA